MKKHILIEKTEIIKKSFIIIKLNYTCQKSDDSISNYVTSFTKWRFCQINIIFKFKIFFCLKYTNTIKVIIVCNHFHNEKVGETNELWS